MGERRHTVTVVVARLSMTSATHAAAIRQSVLAHDGTEIADGRDTTTDVTAVFTAASAAAASAIAMQQAVTRLNRRSGKAPVSVGVGMALGEATFDDECGVWGEVPTDEATAAAEAAAFGSIDAGGVIPALLGRSGVRFSARELVWSAPPPDVPVPGALLTGPDAAPFVGRSAEADALRLTWKQASEGSRRIAFVVGPAGIGKTRLGGEVASYAHANGGTVLYGRCEEHAAIAYQPFADALAQFAAQAADVAALLGPQAGELVRLAPEIRERVPGIPRPLKADPEAERSRLFDAVVAWLSAASRSAPVLLVLDDLHWATPPTLLLLRHLARTVDPMSVMVLVLHRDGGRRGDPATELLAEIRRDGGVDLIELGGLAASDVGAMVETVDARRIDDVAALTNGNPFLVHEVVRHLRERGSLVDGQTVMTDRVASLPPETRRALEAAAVLGGEFDRRTLAGLVADASTLDSAIKAGLVEPVPQAEHRIRFAHALVRDTVLAGLDASALARLHGRIADELAGDDSAVVAVAHHAIRASSRDVAGIASRAARRLLDQLAYEEAAALAKDALELVGDGPHRAGLLLLLAEALWSAGDTARARVCAIDAASSAGDGDGELAARAALAVGRSGVTPGVVDGQLVRLLESALAMLDRRDSRLRAALAARLATELYYAGPAAAIRREDLAARAVAMARRLADPAALAQSLEAFRFATWSAENLGERLAASTELVERARQSGDVELVLRGRMWRIVDLLESGDVREADEEIGRFERTALELHQPSWLYYAAQHRAMRSLMCDALPEAERRVEAALVAGQGSMSELAFQSYGVQVFLLRWQQGRLDELAGVFGEFVASYPAVPAYQAGLGFLHATTGEPDRARAVLERLTGDGVAALPDDANRLVGLCLLSLVAQAVGDRGAAAILHRALAPFADHLVVVGPRSTACVGMAEHYLAGLAALLGLDDESDARYAAALRAHEAMGADVWATHTRTEWGRALVARGDVAVGRPVLEQAVRDADELGMAGFSAAGRHALERARG